MSSTRSLCADFTFVKLTSFINVKINSNVDLNVLVFLVLAKDRAVNMALL